MSVEIFDHARPEIEPAEQDTGVTLRVARMRRVMEVELGDLRARMRSSSAALLPEPALLSQPAPPDSLIRDKIDEIEVALSREWVRGHRGSQRCSDAKASAMPTRASATLLPAARLLVQSWAAAEGLLLKLIASPSSTGGDVEAWLALLGAYKALGQYDRFTQIAAAYAQRFGGGPALGWSGMRMVWRIQGAMTPLSPPVPCYVWHGSHELSGVELDALDRLLRADASPNQLVLDWAEISSITPGQIQVLRGIVHRARFQRRRFVHLNASRLIRLLEEHCVDSGDSPCAGELHLEVLRWLGWEADFAAAALEYSSRYGLVVQPWHGPACVSHAEEPAVGERGECIRVLSGELCASNPGQLLGLYDFSPGPGTVVHVNCRRLVRLDDQCAQVFRRWIHDCSSHGASIFLQDLHPLLGLSVMGSAGV